MCHWFKVVLALIISVLFVDAWLDKLLFVFGMLLPLFEILIICLAVVLACSTCVCDCVAAGRCLDPYGKHLCGKRSFDIHYYIYIYIYIYICTSP